MEDFCLFHVHLAVPARWCHPVFPSAKLCVARDSSVTPQQNLSDQPSSSWFKKQQKCLENASHFLGALSWNANAAGLEVELDSCSGGL